MVDQNDVIIYGHGRVLGGIRAGKKKAPCIVCLDMSPEQIKNYRALDNLLAEGEYDREKFAIEMPNLDLKDYDFSNMGYDFGGDYEFESAWDDETLKELEHLESKENTQFIKENILNLAYAQFEGEGEYDIPKLEPVKKLPQIDEWIGFNYVLSDKSTPEEKKRKGVHF